MNKKKVVVFIYGILIFLLGIAFGVMLSLYFLKPPKPSEFRQKFFEKLKKELNLTNDQSLKIGFILDRRAQDFKNIKQKFRQDFAETHKQLRAEIEQELTPDQKEKFKIMVEKYERKIKNKD
ncbi:MAG TPA: hypothetical protein PLM75_04290 [bacterium]|nr:hypothetical protein [bacterium]HPP87066.1 hypothetical protein [bacterium]